MVEFVRLGVGTAEGRGDSTLPGRAFVIRYQCGGMDVLRRLYRFLGVLNLFCLAT